MNVKFDFKLHPGQSLHNEISNYEGEPLVSIITPFFNNTEQFWETVASVLNQTFPWFEWIIIDDGSTNHDSLEMLNSVASMDRRICIIHQKNSGTAAARNAGIDRSASDYILPLDSDDVLEPTYIEYCWWMLEKNPDAAWAYTSNAAFEYKNYLFNVRFDPEKEKTENLLTVTALIRKKWMLAVGKYGTFEKNFDEDWYFWLKMMSQGAYPVQATNEYLFWYRQNKVSRFSSIHSDAALTKRNKEIIEKEANCVIRPKMPIVYPLETESNYQEITKCDFNRTVYNNHNKLNILFIFPWFSMGGADAFNFDLISGLNKDKYSATIVTTVKSQNEWLQKFRTIADQIFNLPNFMQIKDYPEFISYLINSRNIDLVFVSNSYIGYCMIPWIRKIYPHISIVDYVHMEEWYWRNGGYARISSMLNSLIDCTYVCNSATRDVYINKYDILRENVKTVHIGIDPVKYDRTKVRFGLVYEELGISKDRPIVLFICRIHPQKRPFLMLEIAKRVKNDVPNVAVVVVGDGEQLDDLREATSSQGMDGTIYFVGAQEEVRPYYRDAKVTLICSTKEGLSLTAYESCAMGVPVISADVGGQKDLIDNTVGALIPYRQNEERDFDSRTFSPEEIEDYTNAIKNILGKSDKDWNEMSKTCREKILNRFSIKHMTDYFNKELRDLCFDENRKKKHKSLSEALNLLGGLADDYYIEDTIIEDNGSLTEKAQHHNFPNIHSLKDVTEILMKQGEELNRHEEVVSRHEKSINHQWKVQKEHQTRIESIERWQILRRAFRMFHRILDR